jgi:hypothetical protein
MFQSKPDRELAVFHKLVHFLCDQPQMREIPYLWQQNLISLQNRRQTKSACYCDEEFMNKKRKLHLFPVFPATGDSVKGVFSVLPFFYTASCHVSKAIDTIEIIELPLLDSLFMAMDKTFEELESCFFNIGVVHRATQKKIDLDNISQEIDHIRKSAISKITNLMDSKGIVTFSIFKNLSEEIKNKDGYGYLKYCTSVSSQTPDNSSLSASTWNYRCERKIPFADKKDLYMFYLDSWDLSHSVSVNKS